VCSTDSIATTYSERSCKQWCCPSWREPDHLFASEGVTYLVPQREVEPRDPEAPGLRSPRWPRCRAIADAFTSGTLSHGQPFSIAAVPVRNGKIVELAVLTDAERLRQLDLTILDD
jgi:hypothetical protein